MVNIGKRDLSSTSAFVNSVSESYYPNGNIIVKGTSFSEEGVLNRTLTSRTISDVMSGDALFRSPKYSLAFYNKAIGSSYNSLLTGGAQTAYSNYDSLTIQNPESIDYEMSEDGELKPAVLRGGVAYNRMLADSLSGKKAGQSFAIQALDQIYSSQFSMSTQSSISDGSIDEYNSSSVSSADAVSAGSRQAAVVSRLVPGEEGWILERGSILKNAVPAVIESTGVLVNGYNFDIPDSYTGFKYADGSSSFPGLTNNTGEVDPALIKAKAEKIYICPALIECLIYLNSKIHFYGGFDIGRKPSVDSKVISNHTVGRAFDIKIVGNRFLPGANFDIWNNAGNLTVYRNAVTLLLTAINSMPEHLKPDMIVMAAGLASEFNIIAGKESANAEIYKKYPGCKNINFGADSSHNNHIHMSFSSARSGIYSGPGGTFSIQPVSNITGSTGSQTGIGTEERRLIYLDKGVFDPKFTTNYTGNSQKLTSIEIFNLLSNTVCGPEAAAFFSVIAGREGSVYSLNSKAKSLDYGDFSIGMFQTNMLAHGIKMFTLLSGSSSLTLEGWKIASSDWQTKNLTTFNAWKNYVIQKYNAEGKDSAYSSYNAKMIGLVDNRIWVPLTQAYMLYTTVTGNAAQNPFPPTLKLGMSPFSGGNIFNPWGDYGKYVNGVFQIGSGPAPGVIYAIRYSNVVNAYVSSGRSEATLRQWFLNFYSPTGAGAKSRSVPLIASWLSGAYYGNFNSTSPT